MESYGVSLLMAVGVQTQLDADSLPMPTAVTDMLGHGSGLCLLRRHSMLDEEHDQI